MMSDAVNVTVMDFPLERIRMRGNARTNFDRVMLEELAASVRDSQGPLQMPLGCLLEDDDEHDVELLFGERRLRAMELNREIDGARWGQMKVRIVPTPTEAEFLKWSLAENLQRENLKPSEMGLWMKRMLELADPLSGLGLWTVSSLSEEIGKPVSWVQDCLNAVSATENVRKAMDAGQCSMRVAGMIGSLPVEVQEDAAGQVIFGLAGPMKVEEARTHISTHFRRDMRGADFDPEDGDLLEDAPACSACEWWGGNRSDVSGVMRSQTCLNPACFGRKQAAVARMERARLMEEGGDLIVMDPEEGLELFEDHSGRLDPTSGYVDLKARPDAYFLTDGEKNRESMATWGKILEESCPTKTVVWDPRGRKRELVETGPAVVAAMGSKYGSLFRAEAGKGFLSAEEKAEQSRVRSAMDTAGREVLVEGASRFFSTMSGRSWDRSMCLDVLELAMEQGLKPDDYRMICDVVEPGMGKGDQTHRGLMEVIEAKGLDMDGVLSLLVLVLQVRLLRYEGFDSWVEEGPMESLCETAGFDPAEWVKEWKKRRTAAERKARLES